VKNNAVTSKEHRGRALPLLPPLLPFSFAPVLSPSSRL
jgi:hypothetical protein